MDFRILGSLEVYDNGRPLALGGHQQRALLALLLLRANLVVPVDEIVEDLWGARPPASATKSVQALVSKLRRVLAERGAQAEDVSEDGILLTRSHGYVLTVVPGELDLDRFQSLTEEGRRALAAGRADDAAERLREALALWRGRPLAELAYESFAQVEIARLEELRLSALEERIEADLALGRHHDLIPEVEALVRENPLRERLRGQLMLALYRSGRQAEALQAYQRARHTLVDELGIEPGQALQRLEQSILRQDGSLDLSGQPGPDAEVATREPPVQTLPRPERLSGAVTFLFTDIEGSTRLVKQLRERWGAAVADHQRILREAFAAHRGQEIDTHGDAFFVAFGSARHAVLAAAEAQRALAEHVWPEGADLRVRIGIHSGQAALSEDRYLGLSVHRAARICEAAHGSQVLLSQTTANLLEDDEEQLPGIELRDLGEQRLKDLDRPVRIYQLVVDSLPSEFPPPERDADGGPYTGREEELAEAVEAVLSSARRWRLALGIAAVAAAGIAAFIALLAFRGGESITVRPNSVAVIDPKTNKVVADVKVGTRPGAVTYGESAVWVANPDDSTLSRIIPKTREVERSIPMEGVVPSDVAAGAGGVWVADGRSNEIVRVSPDANRVVDRFDTEHCGGYEATIAVGEGSVWFVCGVRLARIDPVASHALSLRYLGGLVPRGIAVGLGAVWISNGDNTVARISPRTNQVTDTATVAADPWGLATGYGSVWVSGFEADKISRLTALEPGSAIGSESIAVGDGPVDVATGAGGVWVANNRDGTVSRIDPRTNEVVATIRLGNSPRAIAVGGGAVWVTVQAREAGGLQNRSSDAHS
jgi:YVTN family beta-propeller protein